ncbi:membrane-spanning 4-domains subfamily A member 5-like isoform X2 [Heterodontus francisci]
MAYPDFFTAAHLPPGSYMAAGHPDMLSDEEEKMRRRLSSVGFSLTMSGIASIILGIITVLITKWYISFVILLGTPWWTGLFSTVAGMLALAVRTSSQSSLSIGCLVMNVINGLACIPAIILYALTVNFYNCYGFFCFFFSWASVLSALMVLLLLNCIFSLALSVVVAMVNCKRLRCCTTEAAQTMIIVQAAPPDLQLGFSSSYPRNEQPAAYSASTTTIYNVPI